jgi:hypothetical protein
VYCANNPVLLTDPDGMTFTGDSTSANNLENQAKNNVSSEKKLQNRLQNRIDRRAAKGKSTERLEKRMAKSQFREGQFQSTVNEIDEMRASNTVFNINTNYSSTYSDGNTEYGGTDANGNPIININVSSTYGANGGLAHELVHGYQFESGDIDFKSTGSPGLLYDITDEMSAFTRQLAFTGNSAMYNVNEAYVRNLTNASGSKIYSGLPSGPLNINTSAAILQYNYTKRLDINLTPYMNLNLPYIHK